MSQDRSESKSPVEDDDVGEDDGSGVESWLRRVAHAPSDLIPLPQIGQIIGGKYRIEEQLGRGGMGAVFRATHVVSDKPVALKWMLRPATDERARERFTREARAAGRIDHPNVVDVYDIGQDGDAGYLVMELLRGESLRHRLARGPLGATEAADLLLPAMRGVAAAHREGVVHRDLKPDNIFLCRAPDGAAREAKVLDFGISTIRVLEADGQTTLTKEGTVLGTPSYMSPEQLANVRDADARSDVYAFGVILYEALTGSVPFTGDSYSALVLAIANSKVRPPRQVRPAIPVELERIVLRAMEKDRAVRLQNMDALIAALLPFASVRSSGSGEMSSVELSRPTLPGGRRGGAVVTAVLLAAAALAWWWLRSQTPIADGPIAPPTAPAAMPAIAQPPPAAPPALAKEPAVPAEIGGERVTPEPPRDTAPSKVEPARVEREPGRNAERAARPAAEARPAAAPAAAPATSAARARSGSIKLDDL